MARLVGIEIEWTAEQKRLIGQISAESTGAIIAVRTEKTKVDGELDNPALLKVLEETNAELLRDLGAGPAPDFESILAIALAW